MEKSLGLSNDANANKEHLGSMMSAAGPSSGDATPLRIQFLPECSRKLRQHCTPAEKQAIKNALREDTEYEVFPEKEDEIPSRKLNIFGFRIYFFDFREIGRIVVYDIEVKGDKPDDGDKGGWVRKALFSAAVGAVVRELLGHIITGKADINEMLIDQGGEPPPGYFQMLRDRLALEIMFDHDATKSSSRYACVGPAIAMSMAATAHAQMLTPQQGMSYGALDGDIQSKVSHMKAYLDDFLPDKGKYYQWNPSSGEDAFNICFFNDINSGTTISGAPEAKPKNVGVWPILFLDAMLCTETGSVMTADPYAHMLALALADVADIERRRLIFANTIASKKGDNQGILEMTKDWKVSLFYPAPAENASGYGSVTGRSTLRGENGGRTVAVGKAAKPVGARDLRPSSREAGPSASNNHEAPKSPVSQIKPSKVIEVDIRATREKLGMTQEQFADAFDLSLSSLRNWEQGTRAPGPVTHYLHLISKYPALVLQEVAEIRKSKSTQS